MIRRVLFQVHWLLGISAGFVLAVMGVTGALLSFEDEILAALSQSTVAAQPLQIPLTPDALVARLRMQRPAAAIGQLRLSSDARHAVEVRLQEGGDHARERGVTYVDPYSGRILGASRGGDFFTFVEDLHRFLALPPAPGEKSSFAGRQITGAAAIALVFFALSGLYLRWPRHPLRWRAWLVLDLRRTGRNLHREIHAVAGGWVLLCYLIAALTGLTWSYDGYRRAVDVALGGDGGDTKGRLDRDKGMRPEQDAATARSPKDGPPRGPELRPTIPGASLDAIWTQFRYQVPTVFGQAGISLPRDGGAVRIERPLRGGFHGGVMDLYFFDATTGALTGTDLVADRPVGRTLLASVLAVHSGAYFGLAGRLIMLASSLAMPLFLVTGWVMYLRRRAKHRHHAPLHVCGRVGPDVESGLLVIHASQTGSAHRLAEMTAAAFAADGQPVKLAALSRVDASALKSAQTALLVASTHGEGEPPDTARAFARRVMAAPADLPGLRYAVLALGDREYPAFCRFGRQVDDWLAASGATPLFDRIDMDGEDASAVYRWSEQLARLGAHVDPAIWRPAPFRPWRLKVRRLLNAGSAGGPAYLLRLVPANGALPAWRAGDLVEIRPHNAPCDVHRVLAAAGLHGNRQVAGRRLEELLSGLRLPLPGMPVPTDPAALIAALEPLPLREYTIASLPEDGAVELLVRQVAKPEGLGLGSGWLTRHLGVGRPIELRIRTNAAFRRPRDARLILIGNGTGMAGLRAHLKESARQGIRGHWLMFGERTPRYDAFFKDELEAWRADGTLARLDQAWSRTGRSGRYVQDVVAQTADVLRAWVSAGAAIMVCGSLAGMAPAVDDMLRAALGEDTVDRLAMEGRYRRDVY